MNGQNLKTLYESLGPRGCVHKLSKLLGEKKLRPDEFSIKELAESFCGTRWVQRLHPGNTGRFTTRSLMEAGDGVDVSAFSNITGQLIFSKIHEGWEQVATIGDEIFETVPTKLDGEKIPGIGRITGEGQAVHPGMPFPEIGFGEQYWTTPSTIKHGAIVSLTKEAIFFDRTALILRRAAEMGERLKLNIEKRKLAVLAGITVQIGNESFNGNNHSWKGVAYNTYATSANAIGINAQTSLPLTDWRDIETLEQLFVDLLDPDTSNPIMINPDFLIVQPRKYLTSQRIVTATEVRHGDHDATNAVVTLSKNPLAGRSYKVMASPLLYQLLISSGLTATQAAQYWWIGQSKKAFYYMQNWPLQVFQAPAQSIKEFEQDIVLRWRADERGVPWVADPRFVARGTDT